MKLTVAGRSYDIITLDFETFYSKDYTLTKLSTSEYIRDARFHAHGVGIKINNTPTKWYTGKNIPLALKEIDWSRSAMLGHHTQFDGFISSHYWDINPAFYLDTLSMSRAVHGHQVRHDLDSLSKRHGLAGKVRVGALANTKDKLVLAKDELAALGGYCTDDVENTYKLFWAMHDHISDEELKLIDITVRMFCRPRLLVDIPRVEVELTKEIGKKADALDLSGASVTDLMSNPKFAALLTAAGAKIPMKISPTTGELTHAFAKNDLDFQALAEHKNPKIVALCQARLRVKSTIGETRAVRFIEAGKDGMRLPVYLAYCGAHTTRWSGGNKCLSGDTLITVLRDGVISDILIYKLLPTDLVWDGKEFVTHEGLIDQGFAEVIEHDGICGTTDHLVFTHVGPIELGAAHVLGLPILVGDRPKNMEPHTAEMPDGERSLHES